MVNAISQISVSTLSSQQRGLKQVVSNIGKQIPNKVGDFLEMTNSGAFGKLQLITISILFILGSRFLKARDKHEAREVLTRDASTFGVVFFGVPIIKNIIGSGIDKLTKIPTVIKPKNFKEFFKPNDLSFNDLKNWYSKADKMPEKVLTMAKDIVNKGGDLAAAFNTLGEDAKNALKTILKGKEYNSKNILTSLSEAAAATKNFTVDDGIVKGACDKLTQMLSNPNNALVQKAQRVKAIPYLASILLTTSLLGWGIPAFNIMLTRKKVKNEQGDTFKGNHNNIQMQPDLLSSKLSPAQKAIIDNFLNRKV